MQIITNEPLIKRNARIGQVTSIAGLILLIGALFINIQYPDYIFLSLGIMVVGFILSQIGIFFGNRWSRRPRPDETLTAGLKGLDGNYTLYHYSTPTAHLLLGPTGLWVILPRHQRGLVTYDKGRWRLRGGGFIAAYLRIFAQEGLGRPDLDAVGETEAVQKYLETRLGDEEIPPVNALLVFTNSNIDLQVDDPPIPAVTVKKLKDFIRKVSKEKLLPGAKVKTIQDALSR